MEENIINGKIAIKQKEISVETDPEKRKFLQSQLIKLNLRKELEKQTKITQNLKNENERI
jgi:hypothetical protein